jgi:Uma2 family endonuclease
MSATLTPAAEACRFLNAQEWLDALGGVPLERIVWDPWPGTATEADLLEFVEREPKRLVELVDGTLVEKPVSVHEANVASVLNGELYLWGRTNGDPIVTSGADSTLRMASVNRLRMPDLSVFFRTRLPGGRLPRRGVPELSPDIAVEVLSPSNTPAEMRQKMSEYFANGTRLAWLIDPRTRTVAVHTAADEADEVLGEDATLAAANVLPDFAVPVATLFRDLPDEVE